MKIYLVDIPQFYHLWMRSATKVLPKNQLTNLNTYDERFFHGFHEAL